MMSSTRGSRAFAKTLAKKTLANKTLAKKTLAKNMPQP
jgi:hypothetical protein